MEGMFSVVFSSITDVSLRVRFGVVVHGSASSSTLLCALAFDMRSLKPLVQDCITLA